MDWTDLGHPALLWALAALILLIAEFMVPGLILFFLALGAAVVALVCLLVDLSLNGQILLFVVASAGSLLLLRRVIQKTFLGRQVEGASSDSLETLTGERAEVTEAIAPDRPGKVVLHGAAWDAEADEALAPGTPVVVVAQRSIHLKVTRHQPTPEVSP